MGLSNTISFSLITASIVNACCDGMWIGYSYDSGSDAYTWDGATCSTSYENWAAGQPDDLTGSEEYAAISYTTASGTWDDYGVNEKMECGCQMPHQGVPCTAYDGYRNFTDANEIFCYYIHEETTTFTECSVLCAGMSAEMLCIVDVDQNDALLAESGCDACEWYDYCDVVNVTCCPPVWIGYDQAASGVWSWADGSCSSSYTNWNGVNGSSDEPAMYGENEVYAVLGEWDEVGTWYTAPGGSWDEAWCGCEIVTESTCDAGAGFTSYNSSSFDQTCYYISNYTMTYDSCVTVCAGLSADMLCIGDSAQNEFISAAATCVAPVIPFVFVPPSCFWHYSHLREEWLWFGLGVPSILIMCIIVVHMALIVYNGVGGKSNGAIQLGATDGTKGDRRIDLSVVPNPLSSAYGRLLDMPYEASESEPELRANSEVDETVNRWLLRGAVAEIVFAMGLGGLGCTMLLHSHWIEVSLYIDAIEGLLCFGCKIVILTSSYKVYTNLSPLSREVSGYWIHVFAVAKFLMGVASFHVFVGYMIFASDTDYHNFCVAAHVFYSALLSMIVFQTITGVALYKIHINAVNKIGDINRFYDVAGFWWAILVIGTFGVGVAVWLIGADFMIKEDRGGFQKIGIYFSIAAICQASAGAAIFCINSRVRAHFAGSGGEKTIQMMVKK